MRIGVGTRSAFTYGRRDRKTSCCPGAVAAMASCRQSIGRGVGITMRWSAQVIRRQRRYSGRPCSSERRSYPIAGNSLNGGQRQTQSPAYSLIAKNAEPCRSRLAGEGACIGDTWLEAAFAGKPAPTESAYGSGDAAVDGAPSLRCGDSTSQRLQGLRAVRWSGCSPFGYTTPPLGGAGLTISG